MTVEDRVHRSIAEFHTETGRKPDGVLMPYRLWADLARELEIRMQVKFDERHEIQLAGVVVEPSTWVHQPTPYRRPTSMTGRAFFQEPTR